jgi:hypothetical protein
VRLWTLHPSYLDPRGLVALWREALLAQAVLAGATSGYRRHPQLDRFRAAARPLGAIAGYLRAVRDEAARRGYAFDGSRIRRQRAPAAPLVATRGQLAFEWDHLRGKLARRDPAWLERISSTRRPRAHPSFRLVPGPPAPWERGVRGEGG